MFGAVAKMHPGVRKADGLLFGQASVRKTFENGPFAGKTIGEVASGLKTGVINPDQLPIDFIVKNDQKITINNRSLTTLRRAGTNATKMTDRTGNPVFEQQLKDQMRKMNEGSDTIRIRAGVPGVSTLE